MPPPERPRKNNPDVASKPSKPSSGKPYKVKISDPQPQKPEGTEYREQGGVLYVVATPIGNLRSITFRALDILRDVDLIAAEDTRRVRKILSAYQISTPTTSYHEHNERQKSRLLLARLIRGEKIALVSNAGTPLISDPGYHLLRGAIEAKIPIRPITGASAPAAALSVCGFSAGSYLFIGFLPVKKKKRKEEIGQLTQSPQPVVFFESPYRIIQTLQIIEDVLGDRKLFVGREMTKRFEEYFYGTATEIKNSLQKKRVKGEFTVVIDKS
jgi:16S rRNA (cytidine1402-2'-O)-methyltransferase